MSNLKNAKEVLGKENVQEKIKLNGKLFWAKVHEVDSESSKYQVDLSPDEPSKAKLEDLGIQLKNKNDDRGEFVTLRTKFKPMLFDRSGDKINENTLIGNGSEALVIGHVFDWTFKSKKGQSLGLDAVQILTLVPYSKTSKIEELLVKDTDLDDSSPFDV